MSSTGGGWTVQPCSKATCSRRIPWPDDDSEAPMCLAHWDADAERRFLNVVSNADRWQESSPEERRRRLSGLHRLRRAECPDCGHVFETRGTNKGTRCVSCRRAHRLALYRAGNARRRARMVPA